jgi:nicotinamide-nucleotide amidase
MKAEIITIGDEILIGQIVNTNAAWLAKALTEIGVECVSIRTVRDSHEDICCALDDALKKVDLIIFTGGLGPTNDDLTKNSLCEYFKDSLVVNEDVLYDITAFFKKKGKEDILDLNTNQALVPSKAKVIRNRLGTAPGLFFQQKNKNIVAFPGVPYEMKALMNQFILDFKKENELLNIVQKTIFVSNIPESELASILKEWELAINSNIKLAYLPSPGLVRLRLSCIGKNKDLLEKLIKMELDKLIRIINFEEAELDLADQVLKYFTKKNATLSVAESCSSGLIASYLASKSGCSQYFKGGIVAYNNIIKNEILDIEMHTITKHTAVSSQVVSKMAENVSKKFNSEYSIATSGYAGPFGGDDNNPIGTVYIAIKTPVDTIVNKFLFSGDRSIILDQVKLKSLEILLQQVKKHK